MLLAKQFVWFVYRLCLLVGAIVLPLDRAHAFCGFYVAKGDTSLFNTSSKVVIARDGDKTVLTMAGDFKGEPKEFALVVPVPVVLQEGQVNVGEPTLIDRIDNFTAPRLVEYFDEDPCAPVRAYAMEMAASGPSPSGRAQSAARAKALGVTIESSFTVGEYDILILSAKESDGLITWLTENEYTIPPTATAALGSYIKQGLKFFVAKVNLEEHAKLGYTYLRPLQMAYESPRFMLPVRLGTLNAEGDQELFIFGLSRKGRIETTNYRTIKIETDKEIPPYIKEKELFGDFYRALFAEQHKREGGKGVFLEYAWDVTSCDPCAAEPLSNEELRKLGAFWIPKQSGPNEVMPMGRTFIPQPITEAFVTRLHVRYNSTTFPDDLILQTTGNQELFQGRYIMRHPWKGDAQCEAANSYRRELPRRLEQEAQTLARLTGWKIEDIRKEVKTPESARQPEKKEEKEPWWKNVW